MASKSGSKPSSPRSFPRMGNISSLQNCYYEGYVKNNVGRDRRPNVVILEYFVFSVGGWWGREGGRVVRQGRWEGSEVAR